MKQTVYLPLFLSLTFLIADRSFSQICNPTLIDFSSDSTFSGLGIDGDTIHFEMTDQGLHLTQTTAGNSKLWLSNNAVYETTWRVSLKLDFNPSGSNLARFQLAGDSLGINAYYLTIGGTKDHISLSKTSNGTNTVLIEGLEKRLDLPTIEVEILASVDGGGNWEIHSKLASEEDFFLEGQTTDQEIINSDYFIVDFDYTSTRADKFWIGFIEVCGFSFPDLIPPTLDTLVVSSENSVDIVFADSVDISEASFMLTDPILEPEKIFQDQPTRVILEYEHTWENGREYLLQIADIKDLSDNALDTLIQFQFFIAYPVEYRDLVLNELMIDPSPQEDLPEQEYIEIYNRSEIPIQLSNWVIKDNTAEAFLPERILLPKEHLLLIPSSAQSDFYGLDAVSISPWPTLNNSSNTITLHGPDSMLIDSISYDLSNYDGFKKEGGWSLERIDPENPCNIHEFWNFSESPLGGTPGQENSIIKNLDDFSGPDIHHVLNSGDSLIQLTFTEPITVSDSTSFEFSEATQFWSFDPISTQSTINLILTEVLVGEVTSTLVVRNISDCYGNTSPYIEKNIVFDLKEPKIDTVYMSYHDQIIMEFDEVVEDIKIDLGLETKEISFSADRRLITIDLAQPLFNINELQVAIEYLSDSIGNYISDQIIAIELIAPPVASEGSVLVTEIFADPDPSVGLPEVEFVEIQNLTNNDIFFKGMEISDGNNTGRVENGVLGPNATGLLVKSSESYQFPNSEVFPVTNWPTLNDAFDSIILRNQKGEILYQIQFQRFWHSIPEKMEGGWSLEMIDWNYPCRGDKNWTSSMDLRGGTPGEPNSVANVLVDNSGPKIVNALSKEPDIVTIYFDEPLDPSSIQNSKFKLNPPKEIHRFEMNSTFDEIELYFMEPLNKGFKYELTLSGVTDCSGNIIGLNNKSVELIFPETPNTGNLILTEVLFDPLPGSYDFIEVFNPTNLYISLKGSILISVTDTIIIDKDLYIPPLSFVALTEDAQNTAVVYTSKMENIYTSELPSLPNKNGKIRIEYPSGVLIDELAYDESMHMKLFNDTEGISLEKVSLNHPSHNISNWTSASTLVMATPGSPNSQNREVSPNVDRLSIYPRVFDPNSAIENFATIQYSLGNAGFIGTVEIYNSSGIKTVELMETEYLPQSGFITWDGRDQNGGLVKPDIYVVFAQFFSQTGEVVKLKETLAIATRF